MTAHEPAMIDDPDMSDDPAMVELATKVTTLADECGIEHLIAEGWIMAGWALVFAHSYEVCYELAKREGLRLVDAQLLAVKYAELRTAEVNVGESIGIAKRTLSKDEWTPPPLRIGMVELCDKFGVRQHRTLHLINPSDDDVRRYGTEHDARRYAEAAEAQLEADDDEA